MRKILVVEDDKILRQFIVQLLELDGYTVLEAVDGDEGLARVREKNCDLVLLDIQMPRRDGWSVLDELKAIPQLKNIPVLMWTALPRVGNESKAREMGASDFLVKPVSPEDLLSKIDVLLSKS
jgi:CheY-like chemotaxis protein